MNFVSPMVIRGATTKPKLATTNGILYSRASGSAFAENEVSYSRSTSPDSVAAPFGTSLPQGAGRGRGTLTHPTIPPTPPELPLYARNDLNDEAMELVTPCQSMLHNAGRQIDLDGAFPSIQEFLSSSALDVGAMRAYKNLDGEDSFGFGGAVIQNRTNRKVRSSSLGAPDDSSSLASSGGTGRGTASTTSVHNKKTQYHKTKLCPWHKDGKCFMGSVCNYAHSREELKPKPDLSKTKLCPEVVKHKTCDRPGCRFAHDFVELRATSTFFKTRLCKFWQRGYCPAGTECRHAHGKEDLRMEQLAEAAALERAAAALASGEIGQRTPFIDHLKTNDSADKLPVNNVESPFFNSTRAPTPLDTSPSGGLTPLYMQCATELLAQSNSESEVVQLLRRLACEGLLPQDLLESPKTSGN